MKLIVGLGNPGEKYEKTRHNLGFVIVDKFLKDYEPVERTNWTNNEHLKSLIATLEWQPKKGQAEKVILAKPKTYMNNSGMAIKKIALYYQVDPADIWVIYDELDLPIGTIKIRFGGAAAGHHGVESIIEQLSTDKFWRFRMGIGSTSQRSGSLIKDDGKRHMISRQNLGDLSGYVLGVFSGGEKGKIKELVKHGSESLQMALEKGLEAAMNRFNTK